MSDSENKKEPAGNKLQETKNTETSASGRRKLLKAGGVVASSALVPEKWQKPVVDTVLLPAHAQTSGPLVGPILVTGAVTPTRPAASMMAGADNSILDAFIDPAHAGGGMMTPSPTFMTPSPTVMAPTPSPTVMYMTPSPTYMTPSPTVVAPTPSPTGCPALGQCAIVVPPNASNQVKFTITNVGTGMLNMMGPLMYKGEVAGIPIDGFFIDQTFSETQGQLSGSDCIGAYTAILGGTCNPGTPA